MSAGNDDHKGDTVATTRVPAALATLTAVVVGLLSAAGAANATPAEGDIRPVPDAKIIAGQYIAVFKAGQAGASTEAATTYGGTVRQSWTAALNGFSVEMTEKQARRLAADPRIDYVQPVTEVHADDTQTPATWGLDRVDQRALPLDTRYTYSTTASNVTAYILDTGIRTSHSDFGGRASIGYDAIGDGRNGQDCHGHGTHVAGTVGGTQYGVAKQVKLVAVRVLNCVGSGTSEQIVNGINWMTLNARRPAVANMSLGGGANSAIDDAVRNSANGGITFAVAAGNGDSMGYPQDACTRSPARVQQAITVGAVDRTDTRASFSNYGTCVDLFAPGVAITSDTIGSDTSTGMMSGTSMASPHVAGVAALYLAANPTATSAQVHDALVAGATSGVVRDPMAGSPNRLLYAAAAAVPVPSIFASTTDVWIGNGVSSSPITVSGRTGNASATLKVGVNIKHTARGDLVIDLVAPDGSAYRLKNSQYYDIVDNVIATYTVNASAEIANGVWNLRVQDVYRSTDIGYIDSWQLTF
jgi:subtilisin family serine protease